MHFFRKCTLPRVLLQGIFDECDIYSFHCQPYKPRQWEREYLQTVKNCVSLMPVDWKCSSILCIQADSVKCKLWTIIFDLKQIDLVRWWNWCLNQICHKKVNGKCLDIFSNVWKSSEHLWTSSVMFGIVKMPLKIQVFWRWKPHALDSKEVGRHKQGSNNPNRGEQSSWRSARNKALSDIWCKVRFSFCFTSKYKAVWKE